MANDHAQTVDELDAAIDAARREYAAHRDRLEDRLRSHFVDAGDVADRLLSVVDEFGREHALDLLAERPDDYGVREQADDWRAVAAELNGDVERLVDLSDRLDDLTHKRDKLAQRADSRPVRIVNIQGQAYEFDAERRELREVQSGTRHDVDLRENEVEELSLTQQLAREAGIGPERDRPARSRNRGRER